MALIKERNLPSMDLVTYWRIVNFRHISKDGTEVVLGGFISKAVSDQVGDVGIKAIENFTFSIEKSEFIKGDIYVKLYELIKESKLEHRLVTPEVEEIKDGEGNITQEHQDAVYGDVETNWFFDSVDA